LAHLFLDCRGGFHFARAITEAYVKMSARYVPGVASALGFASRMPTHRPLAIPCPKCQRVGCMLMVKGTRSSP
jgi:hypothetical protein